MIKQLLLLFTVLCCLTSSWAQQPTHESAVVLFQLNSSTDPITFIRKFETEQQLRIEAFETLSPIAGIYKVTFDEEALDLDRTIQLFYQYPQVLNAQKDHYVTVRETIPTDTLFNDQWHHKNTGQTGGDIDADIDTPDAWDITTGGLTAHNDTIVVCVIESNGVDIDHIDLKDNIWHNYAEIPDNGVDDDNNGYIDDFDGWNVSDNSDNVGNGSHGTRVAGMIGASGNNTTGITGVNWDVKMMIIKGQVASTESSVIAAYNYPLVMRKKYNESFGQEGAFVVATNASWGIDGADPANSPLWCAMYDTLGSYGVLNIAATTNSNTNVDLVGDMPTTCPSDYLVGVTMTSHQDIRANSGYGPTHVDLGAPGAGVFLPYPGDIYGTTSGTSFATPCVTGAVALTYSAPCPQFISDVKYDPSAGALLMRDYILNGTDELSVLFGEVGTSGRLNVKNTIDSLLNDCAVVACDQPYNLRTTVFTDTVALFAWDGFSTDYIFYLQEGSGPVVEIPLTNQDTLEIDTLNPCNVYTAWVKGICGTDTSAFSYPFTFTSDGCCNNPQLILDDRSQDSLVVSWNDILYGTQYDIRYRIVGTSSWLDTIENVTSPLTIEPLDTCTNYELQIKTTCTDSTQGFSDSFVINTLGCGPCLEAAYCDVIGANSFSEWIDSVVIGWSTSVTGNNNGWYQSEDILATFEPGLTYPVALKPGYSGATFTERFTIWIDTDFNGVFDASEALLENISTTTVITDAITIPTNAQYGITKMRIGMNGTVNPIACPTSSFFGEYEDYCVYIGEDAGINEYEHDISFYPNPARNQLTVVNGSNIEEILIFSQDGQLVMRLNNQKTIDISGLSNGIYLIQFKSESYTTTKKFIKH